MARKSQVKAIAARAKQSPVVQSIPKSESPTGATATLTRSAKKKHVKRAKSLKKTTPSPLAVRMQQDLQLTGRGEATQDSYLRAVRKLAVFARKSPGLIDEEELRAYFYYIRNDQLWEPSTIRVAYSGIKFFYSHTCPRDWATLKYLRVEDVLKLPTVLSLDDTQAAGFDTLALSSCILLDRLLDGPAHAGSSELTGDGCRCPAHAGPCSRR